MHVKDHVFDYRTLSIMSNASLRRENRKGNY